MQELVGRLTALDPAASETLKVVSYFDTLLAGGVGVEPLLRGAAVLSGVVAGCTEGSRSLRIAPDGRRLPQGEETSEQWPTRRSGTGSSVWLERRGEAHANDAMVLERLALAVSLVGARRTAGSDGAVELVISGSAPPDERATAAARLRLDAAMTRAIALSPDVAAGTVPGLATAVVATARGLARIVLVHADGAPAIPSGVRAGVGHGSPADGLPRSWAAALIALRLSTPDRPVVDAAGLGAIMLVAEAADTAEARGEPHPDALALDALDARARAVLAAFEATSSVRGAANRLGMHHSSVQARLDSLTETLGYDPRDPVGRTRLALAEALSALARPGLGSPGPDDPARMTRLG